MKKPIVLQYTIDESQLPSETARLLSNSLTRLTSIAATVPPTSNILSVKTVNEVDALRGELSSIDLMLGDVSSIVDQYIQYQNELRASQQSGEFEASEEIDMPDMSDVDLSNMDVKALQTKVAQLQNLQSSDSASFEAATEILPGLKKKTVKINQEPPTQANAQKIEELHQQVQEIKKFQVDVEDLEEKEALAVLSNMNDLDFTDINNVGSQLRELQSRLGKK